MIEWGCSDCGTQGGITHIEGKTRGLKPWQIKQLSKIAGRRIKSDQVITYELAAMMSAFSHETGRQVVCWPDGRVRSTPCLSARIEK